MRHVQQEPEETGSLQDFLDAVQESDWSTIEPADAGKTPCSGPHDWIALVEEVTPGDLVGRRSCSGCGCTQETSITDLLWMNAMNSDGPAA